MQAVTYAGAPIGAVRRDDVLVVTVAGAVTGATYGAALERASEVIGERPIRAMVIDITRAAPLREWADGWQSSEDFCLLNRMPCGLVVPLEMLLPIRRQCLQVAARGVTWIAFLHLEDALSWAATRAWRTQARPPQLRCHSVHPTPPILH